MSKLSKDGLARDITKLKFEWELLRQAMAPHWKRWIRRPWDTHAFVNLFVEARRESAYLVGHVDAIAYPVIIVLLIWKW